MRVMIKVKGPWSAREFKTYSCTLIHFCVEYEGNREFQFSEILRPSFGIVDPSPFSLYTWGDPKVRGQYA